MRYTATFSFDADNFEDARRIAREFRDSLRASGDYRAHDAKLLKLVDPYVNDEVEDATDDSLLAEDFDPVNA